jgi:SNF2 family DNA or RNA helicase
VLDLYPYQKRCLEESLKLKNPALFMEMRLGKTRVAIHHLIERGYERNLVIAPLSVIPVWEEHLTEAGQRHAVIEAPSARKGLQGDYSVGGPLTGDPSSAFWYLINPERLRRLPMLTEGHELGPWGGVVVDESTMLRNPQAQITKLCLGGFRDVGERIILSGCPAPNGLEGYHQQFCFLRGSFCLTRNFWDWRQSYFRLMRYDWYPRMGAKRVILGEVNRYSVRLSRKAAHVGGRKQYRQRYVSLGGEQQAEYLKLLKDWEYGNKRAKYVLQRLTWLARIAGAGDGKVREILSLLKGELHGEKAVIFFRFNEELERVATRLRKAGFQTGIILGDTPPAERELRRKRFFIPQDGPSGKGLRVLCCQIKCVRHGLDLSAADTAIYYSNSYDAEDRGQSEDRLIHPRKKWPCLYVDLISRGTVDRHVVRLLTRKKVESRWFLQSLVDDIEADIESQESQAVQG